MPTANTPTLLRRFASMLYESLLLVGVIAVLVLMPHIIYAMNVGQAAAPWLLQLHLIVVLGAYFVWFWHHGGQTLAMKTWKIRLVDVQGRTVSTGRALLRYVFCWPSLFLFGAGLLWALFDSERQFLHDRLSGTRLTRADLSPSISDAPPTTSSRLPRKEKSHSA